MSAAQRIGRRGSPLIMLAVLLGSWVAARAATWEAPSLTLGSPAASVEEVLFADGTPEATQRASDASVSAPQSVAYQHLQDYAHYPAGVYSNGGAALEYRQLPGYPRAYGGLSDADRAIAFEAGFAAAYAALPRLRPQTVNRTTYIGVPQSTSEFGRALSSVDRPSADTFGHRLLMREAFGVDWHSSGVRSRTEFASKRGDKQLSAAQQVAPPPFSAQPLPTNRPAADRWSLDVFGFYRQGSSLLSVSQGPTPIYGASQIGANLQWRARPSSGFDPRLYARAYHALVNGGESEIAAGVSALPVGDVPIRVFGEMRLTRNPPQSAAGIAPRVDFRPAAYAVTEIPPQKLPLGFSLEAYAAGGYVWGDADTYFLDGQSALTQQIANFRNPDASSAALSLGGGVWGGAQRDASRVDVGPTLRLDMNLGEVPARISLDYREQVAGDAEPDSGIAATVSTRF